nr:HYR domain-containing protein [Chloroflexota bacterium]
MFGRTRRIGSALVVVLVTFLSLAPSATIVALAQETEATPTDTVVVASQDPAAEALVEPEPVIPPDTGPPVLDQPVNLRVNAVDLSGAAVSFVPPTAMDDISGPVLVSCDYASGAVFPIGTTLVGCWAQDTALNQASVSFTVTVLPDAVPPVLDQPANLVVDAVDASGAAVLFTVPTATDLISGAVAVSCDYASGAVFPVGTTTVGCSAQDASLNQAGVSFTVTVNPLPATIPVPTAT